MTKTKWRLIRNAYFEGGEDMRSEVTKAFSSEKLKFEGPDMFLDIKSEGNKKQVTCYLKCKRNPHCTLYSLLFKKNAKKCAGEFKR
jgi:hypothetical protein